MVYLLRQLLSVALLPFVMAVVIPMWIARGNPPPIFGAGPLHTAARIAGDLLAAIGVLLFASSLKRFANEGEGTLAPWDPPRKLVVRGPYRYVRNPMISGVIFVLFGEALTLDSRSQLWWALTFLAVNVVYIPLLEEPQLRERFGASYEEYCRNVRRFLPRATPWTN